MARLPRSTEGWLLLVIAAMCLILGLATDTFWTLANAFDLLNGSATNVIFAVGLLVVLVAGGIDISFAVAASVVQYVTATAVLQIGVEGLPQRGELQTHLGLAVSREPSGVQRLEQLQVSVLGGGRLFLVQRVLAEIVEGDAQAGTGQLLAGDERLVGRDPSDESFHHVATDGGGFDQSLHPG
jgi:ribose/xylose/arabinose/galactoside ABC-type transport system permease subunit